MTLKHIQLPRNFKKNLIFKHIFPPESSIVCRLKLQPADGADTSEEAGVSGLGSVFQVAGLKTHHPLEQKSALQIGKTTSPNRSSQDFWWKIPKIFWTVATHLVMV